MIKDNAQIEADMQDEINNAWPPALREKALRKGGALLDELNAFFVTISTLKAERIATRDFKQALQDYTMAMHQLPLEPDTIFIMDEFGNEIEVANPAIVTWNMVIAGTSSEVVAAYEKAAAAAEEAALAEEKSQAFLLEPVI